LNSSIIEMAESTPVSSEKGMASPPINRILAVSTAALGAVVVCLSVAVARTSGNSPTIVTEIVDGTGSTVEVSALMFPTKVGIGGKNICDGTKVELPDIQCVIDEIDPTNVNQTRFALGAAEQSGANVTLGYQGDLDVGDRKPITDPYFMEGMCPVNVHWHLGTEHLSVGEYDEDGHGPGDKGDGHRALEGETRAGLQCHHYDEFSPKFTTKYDWQSCTSMHVGETYEVHWPHSNMGDCGTPNQYQTPFYDGVFCRFGTDFGGDLSGAKIGVQAQVFTIVNDEDYYYPDLIKGMVVNPEKDMGIDVAKYTGSTTGTSRDNEMCSQYASITWQVDRKCHLISASSFDKMCADMLSQRDDMTDDLYPHGSRKVVSDHLAADNQVRKLRGN